jgi:hypothetical protein
MTEPGVELLWHDDEMPGSKTQCRAAVTRWWNACFQNAVSSFCDTVMKCRVPKHSVELVWHGDDIPGSKTQCPDCVTRWWNVGFQKSTWFPDKPITTQGIYSIMGLLSMSMAWDYVSELRPPTGLFFMPQMINEFGELRWKDIDMGNRRAWRKPFTSATLSITNPTWTNPGANPGLRGEGQATSRMCLDI